MTEILEFESEMIGRSTRCVVAFPELPAGGWTEKYPVLYLLHGGACTCESWLEYTSVDELAEKYGIFTVMPDGGNTGFLNQPDGERYFDYLAYELPAVLAEKYPVSSEPKDNFIAGFSLGAYGTGEHFLRRTRYFSAAGIFSGGLIPYKLKQTDDEPAPPEVLRALSVEENKELITEETRILLKYASCIVDKPPVYLAAGTEEMLNRTYAFSEVLREHGFTVTNDMARPYRHEWKLWAEILPDFFEWLPLNK